MTWEKDKQFEEQTLKEVRDEGSSWVFCFEDGGCLGVEKVEGVEPKEGDTVRLYGKGFGYPVRGVVVEDQLCYYRTEKQQDAWFKDNTYGATAAEWLERWDNGQSIWTLSMGGFGPGYEQAIVCATVELVRHMLDVRYNHMMWQETENWQRDAEAIKTWSMTAETLSSLHLSGAQFSAAFSVATNLYKLGPVDFLAAEEVPDDRKIQASNHWPGQPVSSLEQVREFQDIFCPDMNAKPFSCGVEWEGADEAMLELSQEMSALAERAKDLAAMAVENEHPNAQRLFMRLHLSQEELAEFAEALSKGDAVETLDALCDREYVLMGDWLATGLDHVREAAIAEVHSSNLSKLGGDGKPMLSEAGRVQKGPNYFKPDLKQFVEEGEPS